jgi:hypothetical protein
MKVFARERARLFSITAPFGAVTGAVLFFAFGNQLIASRPVKFYGRWFLFPLGILPIVVAYAIGYLVNRLLIRAYGGDELRAVCGRILRSLVDACLSTGAVRYDPADLLEEEAWAIVKKYWKESRHYGKDGCTD